MQDFQIGDKVKVVIPNHFNRDLIQINDEASIEMIDDTSYTLFFPRQKIFQMLYKSLSHCITLVEAPKKVAQLSDIKVKIEPKLTLGKKEINMKYEFKKGDKVKIPTTKTALLNIKEEPTRDSAVVRKAISLNQDYLYVTRIDKNVAMKDGIVYLLNTDENSSTGDYFSYQDLALYTKYTISPITTKVGSMINSLRDKKFQPLKPINSKKSAWEVIENNSVYQVSILKNKPYTICLLTTKLDGRVYKGIAKCLPNDIYSESKGIEIAKVKAQLKATKYQVKLGERLLKDLTK
jgi:hypothetical protein